MFMNSTYLKRPLRKKSLYSELFWSAFFPDFPVFTPNAGKSWKNADQNNSEYRLFLRRDQLNKSNQFDQILIFFKIHLSELMTSSRFPTVVLKNFF